MGLKVQRTSNVTAIFSFFLYFIYEILLNYFNLKYYYIINILTYYLETAITSSTGHGTDSSGALHCSGLQPSEGAGIMGMCVSTTVRLVQSSACTFITQCMAIVYSFFLSQLQNQTIKAGR